MRRLEFFATMLLAGSAIARPALGQGPRVVEIAPGDSIRLVYQTVLDRVPAARMPGKRLDVRYTTSIPASDPAARLAQADRAAKYFGSEAVNAGARRLSIGICDTQDCVERRHPPSEWHLYERRHEGWRRVHPDRIR